MDLQQLQVDEHDSLEYNDATEEIERELKESETVDVPTDLCLPAVSGAFSNAFVVSGEANGSISGADGTSGAGGTVVAAAHGAGASVSSSTGSSWPAQRARPSSQDVVANGDDSTDTASSADYAVCSESTNSNEQQVIR